MIGPTTVSGSSRGADGKHVDEGAQGGRHLPSPGIIQEEAGKWPAPVLQHPQQAARREIVRHAGLQGAGQACPIQRRRANQVRVVQRQPALDRDVEYLVIAGKRPRYLDASIEMTSALWLASANEVSGMAAPLLDRVLVVDVPRPTREWYSAHITELPHDLADDGCARVDLALVPGGEAEEQAPLGDPADEVGR